MKETNYPATILRKRRLLLVLPALIVPFLTLAFGALGGGKGNSNNNPHLISAEGLNLQLPDAKFKEEKALNKLQYYDQAAYDSAKREEEVRNDPYYSIHRITSDTVPVDDSTEVRVYRKIAELDKAMNEANTVRAAEKDSNINTKEVERLEKMMQAMQQNSNTEDPQMDKLDGMLDKVMAIQHPEKVIEEMRDRSLINKEKVFPVQTAVPRNNISLLVGESEMQSGLSVDTAFYSLPGLAEQINNVNAIAAVIHETRTIVNGSLVKLRILSDVFVNGTLIPKGSFIYGTAGLNGERLTIHIESLRFERSIYPISLLVYDMDGLAGVYIPGAITRDVAKESSDRAIQGIALSSLDPSLGVQAAGAGIEAAKNLLTKKVKLVKVVVKAGYKVLLKDKK